MLNLRNSNNKNFSKFLAPLKCRHLKGERKTNKESSIAQLIFAFKFCVVSVIYLSCFQFLWIYFYITQMCCVSATAYGIKDPQISISNPIFQKLKRHPTWPTLQELYPSTPLNQTRLVILFAYRFINLAVAC